MLFSLDRSFVCESLQLHTLEVGILPDLWILVFAAGLVHLVKLSQVTTNISILLSVHFASFRRRAQPLERFLYSVGMSWPVVASCSFIKHVVSILVLVEEYSQAYESLLSVLDARVCMTNSLGRGEKLCPCSGFRDDDNGLFWTYLTQVPILCSGLALVDELFWTCLLQAVLDILTSS